jgi:hypothetical protein
MNTPIAHEFEPPTVSMDPPSAARLTGMPRVTAAATDNVAVASVQYEVDGVLRADAAGDAPYATRLDVAHGSHVVRALARDTAGNTAWSEPVIVEIENRPVADFRFEEGGPLVVDTSGFGNNGSMSPGVARTVDATRGAVVQLNGSGGTILVSDAQSLDLTSELTLEAWVKPSALTGLGTVLRKDGDRILPRYALNANDFTATPAAYLHIDAVPDRVSAQQRLPLNQWTHVAVTYDGAVIRLFVNGDEKGAKAASGAVRTSGGAFRIGGAPWGHWFKGRLDDIRVYDVAVGPAQIRADMKR